MREFVPARSAYTQFNAGAPSAQSGSRTTMATGGRRRLRSFVMVTTQISVYWNNPTFQFRSAAASDITSDSGYGGSVLFEHKASRFESIWGTAEGLLVDSVEMPGKGIVFPGGIHLWTASDSGGATPGYTITIIYT